MLITPSVILTNRVDLPFTNNVMVVDKVTQVVNEEGEIISKIKGYTNGQPIELYANDEAASIPDIGNYAYYARDGVVRLPYSGSSDYYTLNEIKQGFVIQYVLDSKKCITSFRVLYVQNDPAYDKMTYNVWGEDTSNTTAKLFTINGIVQDIGDVAIVITVNQGQTNFAYGLKGANIYKLNLKRNEVTLANEGDIIPMTTSAGDASNVFVRINDNRLMDIIIIEK